MGFLRGFAASVAFVLVTLPVFAAELVMVEEPGCPWCAEWLAKLGPIYPKTAEGQFAPLRQVDIRDTRKAEFDVELTRPILFTPTFVLVEDGQELARIEGYPGEDFFWGLLGQMLEDQTAFEPAQG
ncbi:thioredoxin family protein [Aliiroseovarius subalbicans]|uniref:thioredoxin family protein n=1 Tax=Aliiroseovarius subalbicans TaxID=2925840 RepID=UPI001F58709F|nr:thioredoxin family protein [Aliiroseovarius subalbicans]MCI2398110.1 thioredoxin family protein [Aliiroseovarius subalbicans]